MYQAAADTAASTARWLRSCGLLPQTSPMFGSEAKVIREKSLAGLGSALLLVAVLAAYANHFHNSFHFDDAHTVENNAAIRDMRNIPLFSATRRLSVRCRAINRIAHSCRRSRD